MREYSHNSTIQEKYYEPDEKLPSGKTPVERFRNRIKSRAVTRGSDRDKQHRKHGGRVVAGAHGIDASGEKGNFSAHRNKKHKNTVEFRDTKSNLRYVATKTAKGKDEPTTVKWDSDGHKSKTKKGPIETTRRALRMYGTATKGKGGSTIKGGISQKLPAGDVHSSPNTNHGGDDNARSRLYQNKLGMGKHYKDSDTGDAHQAQRLGHSKNDGTRKVKPHVPYNAKKVTQRVIDNMSKS